MLEFIIAQITFICIYSIFALSLNFQIGFTGLVNFGQILFFAVGSYTSAMLVTFWHCPFALSFISAIIVGMVAGYLLSLPVKQQTPMNWGLITLAAGEIFRVFMTNEEWIAGGARGIIDIPQPLGEYFSVDAYPYVFVNICLAGLVVTYLFLRHITGSPFGRIQKALREDLEFTQAMGKNVHMCAGKVMMLAGGIGAFSGSLYAHYMTYISPLDFMPIETFLIWAMVIVGGQGNHLGALFGTVLIQTFYTSTMFLKDLFPIDPIDLAYGRTAIIGLAIILVLLYKREGVIREKKTVFPLSKDREEK